MGSGGGSLLGLLQLVADGLQLTTEQSLAVLSPELNIGVNTVVEDGGSTHAASEGDNANDGPSALVSEPDALDVRVAGGALGGGRESANSVSILRNRTRAYKVHKSIIGTIF